ncbi:MAG: 16S rRNA (guanine(527)-N(7))-methyltransferase RsmG [Flavobacterium sp.]
MELILKYFPNITENQRHQFEQLSSLYVEWNAKINVISRKDIEALYERHILHSLGIAKVTSFVPGTQIMDVGTGGGFPGIPLAILFPEVDFYLIDVIGKKIKVVQEVSTSLGLKNVTAEQKRAEAVKNQFDFVVSRAVTNMPDFVSWIQNSIKKKDKNAFSNGVLYLKGGDLSSELHSFPHAVEFPLSNYFEEEFFETKKVVYLPM